ILERSGAAMVMAEAVVRWVGQARSALAMGFTGAVVSVPVFCDSGFVILSPLARSLAARSDTSLAVYAVTLSMGLYTTHVFVPPTPGPIAAAGELGADIGLMMLFGLVVAVPVLLASYAFARAMGRRIYLDPGLPAAPETDAPATDGGAPPSLAAAFAPVLVPVLLIALRSVADYPTRPFGSGWWTDLLLFLGDPNTALLLGVALAMGTARRHGREVLAAWIGDGLKTAGTIILITGAGGALGSVLRATPIGDYLAASLSTLGLGSFGILLPFLVAAALKTALGSSTVAIITTAPLVTPLLGALGLDAPLGLVLTALAVGAGAMTVSHANDSYFWVVSQLSGMDVAQAYRLQTLGSAVAGGTGILTILLLRFLLL
ncbi:MAG: GntP family permease, partial [Bacteroidetes bacterium]